MKILVDKNIPYARGLFSRLGKVKAVSGRPISVIELGDADVLMVRLVTKVNESLLGGKPAKFVGTTTAGIDHADDAWPVQAGVDFSAMSGCDAIAIVEYVFSALLMLVERDGFALCDRTVGIVGVGSAGRRLQACLEALGIRMLLCDPPRADRGDEGNSCSLDELVEQADALTFHTPLFRDGPYEMLHMTDDVLIGRLKPGTILINAYHGAVIDNTVLLDRLNAGQSLSVMLDVQEGEPDLNVALLEKVDIDTAYTAGYTPEGEVRGTTQVSETYSKFTDCGQHAVLSTLLPAPGFDRIILHGPLDQTALKRLMHLAYNVCRDNALLRRVTGIPGGFDKLCKNYLERREWSSLYVMCDGIIAATLLCKLGFDVAYRPTY